MDLKKNHEPDVVITCHKCGEKYIFDKFEMLFNIDMDTPCRKCGFLMYQYISNKMHATRTLLETDPKDRKILKNGDVEPSI